VDLVPNPREGSTRIVVLKFLPLAYQHNHSLPTTLDFTFFTTAFLNAAHFFAFGLLLD